MNVHEYWFKHLHHMHNIRICIFLEDICKIKNFHYLAVFTSTCSCWGKHIYHKHIHLHLHSHEGHLHYKKFSFAPSYGCIHVCIFDKKNCIRHSMNKYLHLHLQYHAGANPCITSTYICICIIMKDTCITSTYICICILMKDTCITRSFHLHHHMAASMFAYLIKNFALDIP